MLFSNLFVMKTCKAKANVLVPLKPSAVNSIVNQVISWSFVKNAFRDGAIRTTGTDIDKILPAMSRFGGANWQEKKKAVIEELKVFFEKYFGVI